MHNGPENEATGRVEGVPNAMNMAAQRLFDKFKRKIGCGSLTNDDVYVSGWCSLAFVGLGTSLVVVSPTLLDLADHVDSSISGLAGLLIIRSVGATVGSVASGFACDRYHQYNLWMLVASILASAVATIVLPLPTHVAVLGVLMFAHGVCLGALDNGVHAIVMRIWLGSNNGVIMQLIHFSFAFGAFLSPLISKPFIRDHDTVDFINVTCDEVFHNMPTYSSCGDTDFLNNCSCTNSSVVGSGSGMIDICTGNLTGCPASLDNGYFFGYAYWVSVIPLLFPVPALIYYAFKRQCCCSRKATEEGVDNKEEDDREATDSKTTYPNTLGYKVCIFTMLFLFMLLYVGLESAFGTYIFTYAVKSGLQFSKQRAAILSSVFWGTFAFLRMFSIILSFYHTPPGYMMTGNLTGSLVAAVMLVIWPTNEVVVWVASGLMGTSMASIFPTTMTWLSEHGPTSGKATAVLAAGATLGDMSLPVVAGVLIDKISPVSFLYFTLCDVVVCIAICGILFAIGKYWSKCKQTTENDVQYQRLQFSDVGLTAVEDADDNNGGIAVNEEEEIVSTSL